MQPDVFDRLPTAVPDLGMLIRQRGVLTRTVATAPAVSPPLTIQRPEIDEIARAFAAALDELALKVSA